MLFCFIFILSACSQNEEDTQEYSGIISDGKAFGYEYTITKDQNKFSWKVGYNGDIFIIEEIAASEDDLVYYMNAVNDSNLALAKLILSLSYFLIVTLTTLFLYKKNRKMLKDGSVIITIVAGIAIYIAFKASIDLSSSLKVAKYYYLTITN